MANNNTSPPVRKRAMVKKPRPDFPLFPHQNGRWAKKVKGKLNYFGKWADDPNGTAALELWLQQKDDLLAGRKPRDPSGVLTLRELANRFLKIKEQRVDSGELSSRTFADYMDTCGRLIEAFGQNRAVEDLEPSEFAELRAKWSKSWGPTTVGNEIGRARVLFRFAYDEGLVEKPIRFGKSFSKPSAKTMRKHRAGQTQKHGERMIEASDMRRFLECANVPVRAMILLGINCGLGQTDCSELSMVHVDLRSRILNFPRPKTGTPRRAAHWPETIAAIEAAIASRPKPRDENNSELIFITKYGHSWVRLNQRSDAIQLQFQKLLTLLNIKRKGLGFYALRHTFRTIADESRDFPAVDLIMGHVDDSMAGRYRERISDERLEAVSNFVRAWLFPDTSSSSENTSRRHDR